MGNTGSNPELHRCTSTRNLATGSIDGEIKPDGIDTMLKVVRFDAIGRENRVMKQ